MFLLLKYNDNGSFQFAYGRRYFCTYWTDLFKSRIGPRAEPVWLAHRGRRNTAIALKKSLNGWGLKYIFSIMVKAVLSPWILKLTAWTKWRHLPPERKKWLSLSKVIFITLCKLYKVVIYYFVQIPWILFLKAWRLQGLCIWYSDLRLVGYRHSGSGRPGGAGVGGRVGVPSIRDTWRKLCGCNDVEGSQS